MGLASEGESVEGVGMLVSIGRPSRVVVVKSSAEAKESLDAEEEELLDDMVRWSGLIASGT